MDSTARDAVNWLLSSAEPAVRLLARRELLGEEQVADARKILDGSMVQTLLSQNRPHPGNGALYQAAV